MKMIIKRKSNTSIAVLLLILYFLALSIALSGCIRNYKLEQDVKDKLEREKEDEKIPKPIIQKD